MTLAVMTGLLYKKPVALPRAAAMATIALPCVCARAATGVAGAVGGAALSLVGRAVGA